MKRFLVLFSALACITVTGCPSNNDTTVVGSQEDYAAIASSPEEEAAGIAAASQGPSEEDIDRMAEQAGQ